MFLPGSGSNRNRRPVALRLAFRADACSPEQIRIFTQHLRVSHADVDFLGEWKLSAHLGALEQTAVEASADGGYDPARYTAEGKVWLVRRTRLERTRPVGGGDSLAIETHVSDFRRARSLRRYEVRRTGGYGGGLESPVAIGSTDWVYCDVESGRPVSVPDEMKLALFGTTEAPVEGRAPRVVIPDEPAADQFSVEVRPSHLDHMQHVNNAIWADFLEDATIASFSRQGFALAEMLDRGGALRPVRIDLEYLGDARLPQTLTVHTWLDAPPRSPDRSVLVTQAVVGSAGERLLRAQTSWQWRRRPAVLGGIPEAGG